MRRESGKIHRAYPYITAMNDKFSLKIVRKSNAKNFNMKFFIYGLDAMEDRRETGCFSGEIR